MLLVPKAAPRFQTQQYEINEFLKMRSYFVYSHVYSVPFLKKSIHSILLIIVFHWFQHIKRNSHHSDRTNTNESIFSIFVGYHKTIRGFRLAIQRVKKSIQLADIIRLFVLRRIWLNTQRYHWSAVHQSDMDIKIVVFIVIVLFTRLAP